MVILLAYIGHWCWWILHYLHALASPHLTLIIYPIVRRRVDANSDEDNMKAHKFSTSEQVSIRQYTRGSFVFFTICFFLYFYCIKIILDN